MVTQSLKVGRSWDDDFHGWADEILLGRKYKKPAKASSSASSWTGASVKPQAVPEYPGKGTRQDVHARLQGIARKSGQVVVKITGGGKTSKSIKSHFDYLSRDGELTLRDQDGREITGAQALEGLAWGWKYTGPAMDEAGGRKEAFNIVFSMPEGSDERAVYAAIKSSAEIEFSGHQWVIVQHFDEPQVHAHVCVKAESMDGQRLNPRKADLQRWRERFAYELRERGIEAEATRRVARLNQERINKPWAVTRLEERGAPTNPAPAQPKAERVKAWDELEGRASSAYEKIIDALGKSDDAADRILGQELQGAMTAKVKTKQRAAEKPPSKEIERG